MLSGLNLCGATLPTHIQRQRYIKKLCKKAFYIIHTKQTENWLNRGQNIQTIDVYKLKYLYQMQNLLKSIHLQIFQPFPNSNWIGASKSQQKTKKMFYLQNWQWWQNTLELPPLYLTISPQKLSTFSAIFALHQIRNPIPCLCAGNLYGLDVFGECFCVKATCCKCDFFSRKPWHIIFLKRSKRW